MLIYVYKHMYKHIKVIRIVSDTKNSNVSYHYYYYYLHLK